MEGHNVGTLRIVIWRDDAGAQSFQPFDQFTRQFANVRFNRCRPNFIDQLQARLQANRARIVSAYRLSQTSSQC